MNTTYSNMASAPLTLDTLTEIAAKLATLGPEPIGAYMKREGFDPEAGGMLVMPEGMRGLFGPYGAPVYVRFSGIIESPVMFKDPMHEFRERLRAIDSSTKEK